MPASWLPLVAMNERKQKLSRVLCASLGSGSHLSWRLVTRTAQAAYPGTVTERINSFSLIWPCSGRGLPAAGITAGGRGLLHHDFTLTEVGTGPIPAVWFLRHFPSDHSAPVLPGAPILWSSDFPHSKPGLKRDCSFYFRQLLLISTQHKHFTIKAQCPLAAH